MNQEINVQSTRVCEICEETKGYPLKTFYVPFWMEYRRMCRKCRTLLRKTLKKMVKS